MEIKILKLLNGEEIIGRIEQDNDGMITVSKPLGLGMQVDHARQQQKLVFVPYMPYSSATEEVILPATSLLIEPVTPLDSIINDYCEATGTIFAPARKLITPV